MFPKIFDHVEITFSKILLFIVLIIVHFYYS